MVPTRGDERVGFFCVADGPAYVPKTLVALLSVRRFHPESKLFVVGRFGNDTGAIEEIERHGVEFLAADLSDVYAPCRPQYRGHRPWPSECFWWTAVPAMLADRGLATGIALDGDTMCVSKLELEGVVTADEPIAGVRKPNGRINSGVLFFDNRELTHRDFHETMVDLYRTVRVCDHDDCPGYCRANGDQGLLRELERRGVLVPKGLPNAYNHLLFWDERQWLRNNRDAPLALEESRVLHFLSKPWAAPRIHRRPNRVMLSGFHEWWRFAASIWPDPHERDRLLGPEPSVVFSARVAQTLRSAGTRLRLQVSG